MYKNVIYKNGNFFILTQKQFLFQLDLQSESLKEIEILKFKLGHTKSIIDILNTSQRSIKWALIITTLIT